ncbi:MAG: putative bifunctional diguanylate cyclase/phosphodiesterase [Mangrovicoccus sp.]
MATLSLRSALIGAFMIASALPLVSFWVWPYSKAMDAEMQEAERNTLLMAQHLSETFMHYTDGAQSAFEVLAQKAVDGSDISFAGPFMAKQNFDHLYVIDLKDDSVLQVVLGQSPAPMTDGLANFIADAKRAAENSPGKLAEIRPGDPASPKTLLIARQFGGILIAAELNTQFIEKELTHLTMGEAGHAVVFDSKGNIIAHPYLTMPPTKTNIAGMEPVRRSLAGEQGTMLFDAPMMKQTVLAAYAPVAETGWGVVIPRPLAELRAIPNEIGKNVAMVFFAAVLVSGLIGWSAAAILSRRLRVVSKTAQEMGEGNTSVRVPVQALPNISELSELRHSFNLMAEQIGKAQSEIRYLAEKDVLTGLLNRGAFNDRANKRLRSGLWPRASAYFIDVDSLKLCNDAFGHATGDVLLRIVADELQELAGSDDLVARLSGDEFALLALGRNDDELAQLQDRMMARLCRSVQIGSSKKKLSCSIGRADWAPGMSGIRPLLGFADKAMYLAKTAGGGRVAIFDNVMRRKSEARRALRHGLANAVAANELSLRYQPIFSTDDRQVVALEALCRWKDRAGNVIPPSEFIPIAEDSGIIRDLGAQIREKAFVMAARIRETGSQIPVTVNLSLLELASVDLIEMMEHELQRNGLVPGDIILEVTESCLNTQSEDVKQSLLEMHRRGFRLALDDFGKGDSSYNRLLNYPVEWLKIDLSVAGSVTRSRQARGVIRTMVETGHVMNKFVVLECVGSSRVEAIARNFGAEALQGHWLMPPMQNFEVLNFLSSRNYQLERPHRFDWGDTKSA